ncbi:hypothetical protein [Riemerella anatipestifer]|uniref:hypothetical protein n=1 Tax=Riemerella anatipestifer TaxID=34085 RepID=UPI00129DB49C|nr:hypothetical protein [Riemerella anatipestifer]MRM84283.1 hypothetical protein [Riemerella anatipestifer]
MKILIYFLFLSFFAKGQSFIIGDSQSFYLARNSKKAKIYPRLAKVGIGILELIKMVEREDENREIENIFISIGVNDGYVDKGISSLITVLQRKFPNSDLFVIKGSYGWGNVPANKIYNQRYLQYYEKFKNSGVGVLYGNIGMGDPHLDKSEYKKLSQNIDCIIKNFEGKDCNS